MGWDKEEPKCEYCDMVDDRKKNRRMYLKENGLITSFIASAGEITYSPSITSRSSAGNLFSVSNGYGEDVLIKIYKIKD